MPWKMQHPCSKNFSSLRIVGIAAEMLFLLLLNKKDCSDSPNQILGFVQMPMLQIAYPHKQKPLFILLKRSYTNCDTNTHLPKPQRLQRKRVTSRVFSRLKSCWWYLFLPDFYRRNWRCNCYKKFLHLQFGCVFPYYDGGMPVRFQTHCSDRMH